jgi:hypothetical protein
MHGSWTLLLGEPSLSWFHTAQVIHKLLLCLELVTNATCKCVAEGNSVSKYGMS